MEEPTDPNFVEDMADVEARNYQQIKDKGKRFLLIKNELGNRIL